MRAKDMTDLVDYVRQCIATDLSKEDAEALVAWYAALSALLGKFPVQEMKGLEPPLRSVPE